MADVAGAVLVSPPIDAVSAAGARENASAVRLPLMAGVGAWGKPSAAYLVTTNTTPPPPVVVSYFRMRARDANCPGLTYRVWVATGAPDPTGAQYTTPFCGAAKNFADAVIEETWTA